MNARDMMPMPEMIVWAAMLGGLLTIAILSVAEWFVDRWQGALRNVIFVVLAGAGGVMMTGLPEVLWPDLRASSLAEAARVTRAGGRIAIVDFAAHDREELRSQHAHARLGGHREDPAIHRITSLGAAAMGVTGLALALVSLATGGAARPVLVIAAGTNVAGASLGMACAWRASRRGDPLARWMAWNCAVLVGMVLGLGLKLLEIPGFGVLTWALTALCAQVFFLGTLLLFMLRHREQRRLARHAEAATQQDPSTGLPTGAGLLDDVGHAFWRATRAGRACTVVMIDVRNLYALSATLGHGSAQLIQSALAARLRRAAGLRSVIGLYQPRCFALVFSSELRPGDSSALMHRLRNALGSPVELADHEHRPVLFKPELAWGSLTLDNPGLAQPIDALREAERRTVSFDARAGTHDGESQDHITTEPAPFL